MSRRSRKRSGNAGAGWLGKAAIGLILAGVVGAGLLYAMVRSYLHSDAFRRFLSEKASAVAKVDGQFTPFRWDGLAVNTAAFDASGRGMVKGLRLEGLHTEVGVSGVTRGVWEIQGSRIQRLEVSIDARMRETGATTKAPNDETRAPAPLVKQKPWLPTEVELLGVDVEEVVVKAQLDQGPATLKGMKLRLEPTGTKHAYRAEAIDGTLHVPFEFIPELRLGRSKFRFQDGQVFLNSASASIWENGRLNLSGEYDVNSARYSFEGDMNGVKCEDLLSEDWAKRMTGEVESGFSVENHGGDITARGSLRVDKGTLTALPVLDALAAYADTRRFRVLQLSEAKTDWRWKNGEIFLSNLVLASEGLVRVEGNLFIRNRDLDGSFRLGLAAGTLANIPGAETDVFAPGERGLLWTTLRITGTLDDPKEDLTDRLMAAAGMRMFDVIPETGEKVIKFSRSLLGDTPGKVIEVIDKGTEVLDKGVKIIEGGSDMVDGVGGVIDGFFGSRRAAEPPPAPPPVPEKTAQEPEKPKP